MSCVTVSTEFSIGLSVPILTVQEQLASLRVGSYTLEESESIADAI